MDLVNLKDDIDYFNNTTLPRLEKTLNNFLLSLDQMISRLDGMTATINLKKEFKDETINSDWGSASRLINPSNGPGQP